MKRESFVFYKSFYDSIRELDDKDQVQIYNAIFQFQFDGEVGELKGVAKSIFTLILPQLEANNKRYLNGCKGGKKKKQDESKSEAKDNQNVTESEPNENDNDNVNDNDIKERNIIKKESFKKPTLEEIEEYCKSRNNDVDARKFYDYYETNNWKDRDGKKLKNWKQKIITWEGRKKEKSTLPNWFDKNYEKDTNNLKELFDVLEGF